MNAKIARLRRGGVPRVLDLFSGCGGLSLGFHAAGFRIEAAVEHDEAAARSHGLNFHTGDGRHAIARDITATSARDLTEALDLGDPASAFDVLVGGPPCQAFARVGRSKLREVAEHPEAFRHDPRARLYIEYLQYVEDCSPLAVVMENVPDMINHGGHNLAAEICEVLDQRGYTCVYTLLNAAYYGVPQMRERMILIAIRRTIAGTISLPQPTHWLTLPSGYASSRQVALRSLQAEGLFGTGYYREAPRADPTLPPAITAVEALGDMPAIDARAGLEDGSLRRGARRFDKPLAYPTDAEVSAYATLMREWPGFEANESIADHVIRYLPRDYGLFARLRPGDQFPEAYREAERMFEEALLREKALSGRRPRKGDRRWSELRSHIVPPYDPDKFPNKWRKMEADRPSRTLLAHLGKDSYSHIHYSSEQARTISVREAARLQSFPDGFRFCGSMNPAFRQIGNAVPPLLARSVAEAVARMLCVSAKVGLPSAA